MSTEEQEREPGTKESSGPSSTGLWKKRVLLLVVSVLTPFLIAEVVLRIVDAKPPFAVEISLAKVGPNHQVRHFDLDPVLGYTPRLGPGEEYDERGLRRPKPGMPPEGTGRRVLFLGDSVLAQWLLLDGIREAYADQPIDVLNAGISGYNVVQERRYYERHFAELDVEQVVLVMHANDLTNSLMLYPTDQGYLFWYFFGVEPVKVDIGLLRRSYIYRRYLMARWKLINDQVNQEDKLFAETKVAIRELAADLEERGIPFRVVMFPALLPFEGWDGLTAARWNEVETLLDKEGIAHTNLYPVAAEYAQRGWLPANQEEAWKREFDFWHPDEAMAKKMGALIRAQGLLDP